MAITNQMIILNEAANHLNEVFASYDEATAYIMAHDEIPLHTFQGWKSRGYSVKKGEHASIQTMMWKFSGRKHKDEETGEEVIVSGHCFLTKAYLFTINQVEKRG